MRKTPEQEREERIASLVRALADEFPIPDGFSRGRYRPSDLDSAALRNVMDGSYKIVQDDDGRCWPFAPGDPYWRGPLRRADDKIEKARFFPATGKLIWCDPSDP